jgi:hypothetical protein
MSRFSRFFFKNRRYDDISVSIQEHIAERIDELMEEGMSRDEAERTARRDFGNVTLLRERSREVWQWQRLESLLMDLKHVCRRLSTVTGVRDHGGAHTRYWHRGEYSCVQCAQQRAVATAALL